MLILWLRLTIRVYDMTSSRVNLSSDYNLDGVDLPANVFSDKATFIKTARKGLSGHILRQVVSILGNRSFFVRLLQTTSGNLGRFYQKRQLDQLHSEGLLDTLRVFSEARKIFGNPEKADEWLNTNVTALGDVKPIDLCDTFEGRKMVQATLKKIEYGEFV